MLRDVFGVAQICNLPYRRIGFCRVSARRTRRNIPAPCRLQIGDTAQRGKAATKVARGLPGRSASKRKGHAGNLRARQTCWSCCGQDGRAPTPSKNRGGLQRFSAILIECNSALRRRSRLRARVGRNEFTRQQRPGPGEPVRTRNRPAPQRAHRRRPRCPCCRLLGKNSRPAIPS